MVAPSLFSDYLSVAGVPHTASYSDRRFKAYPQKLVMNALHDLLYEYKANPEEVNVEKPDAAAVESLKAPCVCRMTDGSCRIVTAVAGGKVDFLARGRRPATLPADVFARAWSGRAMECSPTPESSEPDYRHHRLLHLAGVAERWAVWVISVALLAFFFISNKIYASWSLTLLTVLYGLGVYVCHLLILKQSHVESSAAESVCGFIQKQGCSHVLETASASFLGLFHWSEIGLAFFSVSFGAVVLWPECANYLGYISILCLPYTVWSVLTQRFRIHSWCTLCLCVQTLFWLVFIVSWLGGHLHGLFPLRWDAAVLVCCYALALLLIHRLLPSIYHYERQEE